MVSKRGCAGWLQKRSHLEKILLCLSGLLILTLFLLIIVGIALNGSTGRFIEGNEVCWSSDCIKAAGDVLSSMQSSTDSCSDFYNFACGNYGAEPGQSTAVSRRSADSVYFLLKKFLESDEKLSIDGLQDAKRFYNSCVQFGSHHQDADQTKASLLTLMTDMGIGVWPVIESIYETTTLSLEPILASLMLLDIPVAFKMEIVPDEHLTNSYLIKISPGGPRESGRSPRDIRDDVHLKSSVLASFLLLGSSTANTDVNDILSVDGDFAAIQQNKSIPCDDVTLLAPEEVVSELNSLIPEINWEIFLSEIRNATGLHRPFAVRLHCKKKISAYIKHLNELVIRSEANYLGWRFFSKFVEHIVPTFEKSQFGRGEATPRWRVCLELMEKFGSSVLADVLTHKMINNDIKEKVQRISNSALTATQHLVTSATWLSDPQKSRISEKVAQIRIRYPFMMEDTGRGIPNRIPQVDVSNFTEVIVHRQRLWTIDEFKRLTKDTEDLNGAWAPVLSSSSNYTRASTAFVYFDQLTSPYIRQHGSQWMHLGGFGVSVAREISKVVLMSLNSGRNDEEDSKLWKIWLRSKNSSSCFHKSLSSWLGSGDKGFQSDNLLQDIFLDQSSLEIAYETAVSLGSSKTYSLPGVELGSEKMFFLGYAQTLCNADRSLRTSRSIPAKYRLNAVLFHLDSFNRAFSCENSSPQCLIWA